VAQQARKFNEADAVIMAHGQQMANAIFAIDGTYFVEVGCKVKSLIGNASFMELFDGKYRAVERCSEKKGDTTNNICVVCNDEESDIFTMNPAAFERLIDDVVASLELL
jgi:capsular polysaccharide biosynthesis protein